MCTDLPNTYAILIQLGIPLLVLLITCGIIFRYLKRKIIVKFVMILLAAFVLYILLVWLSPSYYNYIAKFDFLSHTSCYDDVAPFGR